MQISARPSSHTNLHPFQKEALALLDPYLEKETHLICVAPTGAGKSLIYERAASERGSRTLLVTPLVALARQQFKKMKELRIPVTLGAGGASGTFEGESRGGPPDSETGAWIISPEILQFPSHQATLKKWKPNFLVVDECHCLWEWGEKFRPSFLLIPNLIAQFKIKKSLWLTATLPYEARLQLRQLLPTAPQEIGQFNLPSQLQLTLQKVPLSQRSERLLEWINVSHGKGIVFVSSRQATLRISRLIECIGKSVVTYHAGMSHEERQNVEFSVQHQIPDWIVATSAFGMGMNYPHLSHVALWHLPTSILSLVQTIGRVGRTPENPAHALVLWDDDDFQLIEWTVQGSVKRQNEMIELRKFLSATDCRLATLKSHFDGNSPKTPVSIKTLCGKCDVCRGSTCF